MIGNEDNGPALDHEGGSGVLRPRTFAILAAGGSGTRLGADLPKALVPVAGRPLLAWSVAALAGAVAIDEIVVAAPAGHEVEVEELAMAAAAEAGPGRSSGPPVIGVVAGGASRSQSVARALDVIPEAVELVAVHDAARPMVTAALVEELVEALAGAHPEVAAVVAASPMVDTVKQAFRARGGDGGEAAAGALHEVARTLPRDELWAVQTPQVFRTARLREALDVSDEDLDAASDDAALVEARGGLVTLHAAPATNFKVTNRADLELAELLLGRLSG